MRSTRRCPRLPGAPLGPLADEFFRVLQEMQIGLGRADAMRALGERTYTARAPRLRDSHGAGGHLWHPTSQVLRVQASEMRTKRSQRAEELAQKVPGQNPLPADLLHPAVAVRRHPRAGRDHDLPLLQRSADLTVARILVVSRNPAMAMSLAATDHEVLEVRPADFGAWIIDEDVADALVLDLENPRLSVAAVTNLPTTPS